MQIETMKNELAKSFLENETWCLRDEEEQKHFKAGWTNALVSYRQDTKSF